MIADHIVFPWKRSPIPTPWTATSGGGDALETFSIRASAGATEAALVTSVLVLPYRNPVLTAKMVSSLVFYQAEGHARSVSAGWRKVQA
jgi:alkanesulfonate monooxygenase SsuD/methylene tetrahydromethanopterin reductase-like flavin-dependent oxidoreductase (luciferase family)